MDVVRGATFIGALLLAWMSLRPFDDLGNMQIGDTTTGNEMLTYAGVRRPGGADARVGDARQYAGAGDIAVAGFCCSAAGSCVTVLFSLDPGTSIRRFALTACVIAVAAALQLLPKSQHELMRWFSIAALVLLATCYLGILLAPDLSIHLATDTAGTRLAGNWRGSFGHKNVAAGVMAMLVFLGIYFIRAGALAFRRRHHCPGVTVSAVFRRQKFADAMLCRAGADFAHVGRALLLGCAP